MDLLEAKSTISRSNGPGKTAPVGLLGLLRTISFVFSLTSDLSSSRSGIQFLSAVAFQRDTSAPREAGTEYSCW
jgi:hypothetical protein